MSLEVSCSINLKEVFSVSGRELGKPTKGGVARWLIEECERARAVLPGDCVRIRSFAGEDRGLGIVTAKFEHGVKVVRKDGLEYLLCYEEIVFVAREYER